MPRSRWHRDAVADRGVPEAAELAEAYQEASGDVGHPALS